MNSHEGFGRLENPRLINHLPRETEGRRREGMGVKFITESCRGLERPSVPELLQSLLFLGC